MVCAMSPVRESLARRYDAVRPHLTERQCRVWLGAEARELGPEGVRVVADAVGVSPDTVRRGRDELDDPQPLEVGRSRVPGGGRKRAGELDPGLAGALDKLVDPESRGDPMTPLRWTAKSLRTLAGQLRAQGHPASATLVQRLLHEAGYSLQANAKTLEGSQHPDRDAQFRHIHDTAAAFLAAGDPVVSVDAKKKENVGQFKNGGREYQPKGSPVPVNVHDFPGEAEGKAIPYGVYDIGANTGWVSVGTDHETAAFAVNTLRTWWNTQGQARLPWRAPAADHRGQRRFQRQPPPGVEDRAGRAGRRDRPGNQRLSPAAGYQQVEQNRAPPVRTDHQELARQAPDQPRGDHQPDRRHRHDHRADCDRPARYRPLPDRHQGQRPGDERPPDHPRPLAWRVELHAPSRTRHSRAALT